MSDEPLGPSEVPSDEEIEATVAEAVFRMGGELDPTINVRYIAGFSVRQEAPEYAVLAVLERDGRRVGMPQGVIGHMSRAQAEHLHSQLTSVLGFGEAVGK